VKWVISSCKAGRLLDKVHVVAAAAPHPPDLVSPREWVSLLGGQDLAPTAPEPGAPVDVALFRFGDLPDRAPLPAIDAHYVSFTVRGALLIERDLGHDADRARFRPGMSLILPAETENTWCWDAGTDELHLYVAPAFMAEMAGRAGHGAPVPAARFAFEDRLLRSLAEALFAERRSGGIGGALYREVISETIALHLLRTCCAVGELPAPGRLAPAALRRVRELVEAELESELRLDDLARAAGLSRAHFARAFRQATGETPHAYLRRRRVERARRLLADTQLDVAAIAGLTGFSSPSHLGRVFKSVTGVTPGAYRRLVRA
jgi:AraC family transcriptional regulator